LLQLVDVLVLIFDHIEADRARGVAKLVAFSKGRSGLRVLRRVAPHCALGRVRDCGLVKDLQRHPLVFPLALREHRLQLLDLLVFLGQQALVVGIFCGDWRLTHGELILVELVVHRHHSSSLLKSLKMLVSVNIQ
jgi:hypothetical protein